MLLGELLNEAAIKVGMIAQTKFDAIEQLVDALVAAGEVPPDLRDHVVEVVLDREHSMSTGMEHGVALPHGHSDRLTGMVAALGIAPGGIPFDSLDGQPAHIIALLALPKGKQPGYVRTLAGIAHLLRDADFRERLIAAPDARTALELIREVEPS